VRNQAGSALKGPLPHRLTGPLSGGVAIVNDVDIARLAWAVYVVLKPRRRLQSQAIHAQAQIGAAAMVLARAVGHSSCGLVESPAVEAAAQQALPADRPYAPSCRAVFA